MAEDGRELPPADTVVVLTGFRPDLSFLSEMRLDLDPTLQAPVRIAAEIDPNIHSCGDVHATGAADLAHPEPDLYLVGMKSYGRAPTFLAMTGYEQVRSVVAELAGDHEAAARVELRAARHRGLRRRRAVRRPRRRRGGGCCARAARAGADRRSRRPAPDHWRRRTGSAARGTPGGARRRALAALCVTEIVSYGVLYYAFPVLAGEITAGTGWSRTAITAAFSAGNLAGALAGVPAGRLIAPARARGWS